MDRTTLRKHIISVQHSAHYWPDGRFAGYTAQIRYCTYLDQLYTVESTLSRSAARAQRSAIMYIKQHILERTDLYA